MEKTNMLYTCSKVSGSHFAFFTVCNCYIYLY
jgi:hypothetical protein